MMKKLAIFTFLLLGAIWVACETLDDQGTKFAAQVVGRMRRIHHEEEWKGYLREKVDDEWITKDLAKALIHEQEVEIVEPNEPEEGLGIKCNRCGASMKLYMEGTKIYFKNKE